VDDVDVVDGFEVVFHVEFVEVEGDVEGGVFGGKVRCAHECYCEVGAASKLSVVNVPSLNISKSLKERTYK